MKVSIVIPAHNATATIRQCLEACYNQTHPADQVIVVDDGSTDRTSDMAREFPVTLLRQEQQGPAAARNAGAHTAKGDVIAFTDSDCIPHPDWLARLLERFGGDVEAVGGTYGIANNTEVLARVIHAEIVRRHAEYPERIDFAGSYNFAVSRRMFQALGGFDETFKTASAEDNDFCYRMLDRGKSIAHAADAIVDHYHPTRLWAYLGTQMRHGFWRMKLYAKHPHRKSGDKYARGLELWAPLYAVATLTIHIVVTLFSNSLLLNLIALASVALLFLYRLLCASELRRVDSALPVFYAAFVLFLRDFARGFGLVSGAWRFLVWRKVTV